MIVRLSPALRVPVAQSTRSAALANYRPLFRPYATTPSSPPPPPASTSCHAKPTACPSTPADTPTPAQRRPWTTASFWKCRHTWRRAGVNTFRCLVGCSLGDLSMMTYLMSQHPDFDMGTQMALSMAAGISTSILLETTLLRYGKDALPWAQAARTAMGMSMLSMLGMELAENLVTVALQDPATPLGSSSFWAITALSMAAGFVAPLPWNYARLKLYGKACH